MPDFTNDTYVSTPNADEFREATATLVLTDTAGDAWTAAHSIIDSFASDVTTTTFEDVPAVLRTEEAVIPLSRGRTIVIESKPDEIKLLMELEELRHEVTEQRRVADERARTISALDKTLGRYQDELASAEVALKQERGATLAVLNEKAMLHYTVDALRHTLTPAEVTQFDEGVNHLLVASQNERDIEDLTSDNKAMQTTMGHQREEFEARYTRANAELDRLVQFAYIEGKISRTLRDDLSKVVTIVRDAGLIEADYRRFRNEVEKNKQTIARSKQIAAEHVISGRALICAAFARLPERPVVEKLTVDEKLRRANLQSMED